LDDEITGSCGCILLFVGVCFALLAYWFNQNVQSANEFNANVANGSLPPPTTQIQAFNDSAIITGICIVIGLLLLAYSRSQATQRQAAQLRAEQRQTWLREHGEDAEDWN
jgi:hypothetical protein